MNLTPTDVWGNSCIISSVFPLCPPRFYRINFHIRCKLDIVQIQVVRIVEPFFLWPNWNVSSQILDVLKSRVRTCTDSCNLQSLARFIFKPAASGAKLLQLCSYHDLILPNRDSLYIS